MTCRNCNLSEESDFKPSMVCSEGRFPNDRPLNSDEIMKLHTTVLSLLIKDGFCMSHAGAIANSVMTQVRVKCGLSLESQ